MIKNLTETQPQKSKKWPLRLEFMSTGQRMSKRLLTGVLALGLITVEASDHLDRGLFNIAHDLSDFYAFKSPEDDGHVVFVLNYHPNAKKEATWLSKPTWFSPEHQFIVALREANIGATGAQTAFTLDDTEYRFSCVFAMLTEDDDHQVVQTGSCAAPSGETLSVNVNDENGSQGNTFKIFAGLRADPFFMAARTVLNNFKSNSIDYPDPGSDDVAGQNILSIVIEANIQANFSMADTTLFAARSEVLTSDAQPKRLDSIGRPEVTNMVLGVPCLKFLILNKSICEEFNQHDTFSKNPNKTKFRSEIDANLKRWDNMDNQVDWPFVNGHHPLSELLYADYLIMDFAKPFDESGYFGIESSFLAEEPHTTSGGRWLNEDVVDEILTMYISRGRQHYSDFVNGPAKPAEKSFPYVRSPN